MNLSIIIPAYNEQAALARLLPYLGTLPGAEAIAECMVVDGGSTDDTVRVAQAAGVRVIAGGKRGRGAQMNAGAAAATGEVLYFLHADTLPPRDLISQVLGAVQKGIPSGCFRLAFHDAHPFLRFHARLVHLPLTCVRFGDQSLFVHAALFKKIGGFREDWALFEDQEIVTRLKQEGRFAVLPSQIVTSSRRFRAFGIYRVQMLYYALLLGYLLGVPVPFLAERYRTFFAKHRLSGKERKAPQATLAPVQQSVGR